MKAKIEIEMDNAAFEDEAAGFELARILKRLARDVSEEPAESLKGDSYTLFDINGNLQVHREVSMSDKLAFGLNHEVPEHANAAWGARWIFPNYQVRDRQDFYGADNNDGILLKAWLNTGALKSAMEFAGKKLHKNMQSEDFVVVLHEDELAVIKANPRASYGYLYVCAYLKLGYKHGKAGDVLLKACDLAGSFKTFDDLIDAKGDYRPTIDCSTPERRLLANLYDHVQLCRRDPRRAYRKEIAP